MRTLRTLRRTVLLALALLVCVGAAQAALTKPAAAPKPKPQVQPKPKPKPKPKPALPVAAKPSALFRVCEDFRWGFVDKTGKLVASGYENSGDFSDGLAAVKMNGRYGFVDVTGKMVIAPSFDGAGGFSEGFASVRVEKLWGYADKTGNTVIQPQYAEAREFSEGLAVVKIDGKYGAIDKTGTVVIQPSYSDMGAASEGLIAVAQDGKWGFIDKTGATALASQFIGAGRFSGGLAPAQSGGKWGFIDKSGKWVVQPKYDDAMAFSEGLAAVGVSKTEWLRDDDGRVMSRKVFITWGYIDTTGKEVISLELVNVGPFSEGLAPAWKGKDFGFIDKTGAMVVVSPYGASTGGFHNGLAKTNFGLRFGYIDEAGKMVIFPRFEEAEAFSEGLAAVQVSHGGPWGYIDTTGRMKIKPQFATAYDFRNGLARVRGDIKWGIIDKTGKFTLALQLGDIGWHSDKVIAAKKSWKEPLWGFFDWSGKTILEPQFESASFLGDSLAIVRKDGKYGVVDAAGKLVIPTQYDDTGWLFSEGLLAVRKGDKYGFIDATGKSAIEPQYDAVGGFTPEGLCAVKVGGKWGFIDGANKMVIPPQYDMAVCFREDRAAVKVGGRWGFIDKAGKAIVEPKYESIGSFDCGMAPVFADRKWGYVDKAGKLAIPARFDSAHDFARNLAWVRLGNQVGYIDTTGKAVWMSRKYATAPAKAPNISQAMVQIDSDGLRVVKVKVAADQVLRQRGAWREAVEKRMQAVSDLMEKSFKLRLDVIDYVPWNTPEFKDSDDPDKYADTIFDSLSKDLPLGDAEIMIGLTARDPRSSVLGFTRYYFNWMIVYDRYNGAADKEEELVFTTAHEMCHQLGAFHVVDKTSIMNAYTCEDVQQNTFDQYSVRQLSLLHDYDFANGLNSLSQDKIKSAAEIHEEGHAPDVPFPVAEAYRHRADNRWDDGDKAGAFRDYSRSFELGGGEPDFATVYRFGVALYNDGQRVLGIETLRKCYPLKTDPKYAALYHKYLANELAELMKGDLAFIECRWAARPKLGEIYRRYLLMRISPDEVISEYRAAVTAEPKNASYHSALGQTLLDCGRSAEALAEYEQALTLEPNNSYYKAKVEETKARK